MEGSIIYAKDDSLLSQYLEPREGEWSCNEKNDDEDAILMDFGFKTSEHAEHSMLCDKEVEPPDAPSTSCPLSPNAVDVFSSSVAYVTGHDNQMLMSFVGMFCPGKAEKILSEDVLNHSSFCTCMLPTARSFFRFID